MPSLLDGTKPRCLSYLNKIRQLKCGSTLERQKKGGGGETEK